jgi:hypothetical protein
LPVGRPNRQTIFENLDRAVVELYNVGGLPRPEEAEEIWEGIWYEETHHSTAIEGNTLILKEVKTLLDEGRAVGDKEFREYLEVQGYAEAAQWVYRHGRNPAWDHETLISLSELRQIHERAVAPVWRHFPPMDHDHGEGPGSFRRHDIEPFAEGMQPPPWPDVPPLVSDWIAAMNAMQLDSPGHFVMQLADLHAAFERIHPFRDGNGRAGRVALNLALVRVGYPPVIIYKKDRMRYLRGLDRADHGDPGPLAELLARSVKYGIDRFLLPALAGPLRMIPISALADEDLSLIALRRAAERGRLKAARRIDQWYSTRKWVDEYKDSRQRGRRRKPPKKVRLQVPVTPTPSAPAAPGPPQQRLPVG